MHPAMAKRLNQLVKLVKVLGYSGYRAALRRAGVAAGVEHEKLLRTLSFATVVDIGANRGQFALVARRCYPEARIFSFEPLTAPARRFQKIFGDDPLTTLHPVAIGPASGSATMHVTAEDDSSSLLPIGELQELFSGSREVATLTVAVDTLANRIKQEDVREPALLKLDVQGYELPALKGCDALLDRFSQVYVECSFVELYKGQALACDVINFLSRRGYQLHGEYNAQYGPNGRPIQADMLFTRSSHSGTPQSGRNGAHNGNGNEATRFRHQPVTCEDSGPAKVTAHDASDARPGLGIVSNVMAPYRLNLHRLIAAGIPELKLHTLITHGVGDFDWQVQAPSEIHVHNVSRPRDHPLDHPLRRPWTEVRKGTRLVRYLKENNVRAVVFDSYRYIPYLQLMRFCHRQGIPFFFRSDANIRDEVELPFVKKCVKRAIYGWWMRRVSGVFSMGRLGDEYFLKYGADAQRLYRVPYWPDFDSYAKVDAVQLERFRRKFQLREGRRYLLYSGRLVPQKRVDLLIDAFAAIASRRPDWDVLIVGNGVLREELHRRVPELLQPRVVWTGFLDGAELFPAYHAADVFVLPSDHEPWAVAVQEAMAAGLPVIASDVVGAAYELVTDGHSGRIFRAGDGVALQGALEDVTGHVECYKIAARDAWQRYRQEVDPVGEIRRALDDAGVLRDANIDEPVSQCHKAKS